MNMKTTKVLATAAAVAAIAIPAFAQVNVGVTTNGSVNVPGVSANATTNVNANADMRNKTDHDSGGMMGMRPAVVGKVTAVSGTTISIESRMMNQSASTTYTVNASSATIMKANATSTVSSIKVGDEVLVIGTVSGTTVNATLIRDGMIMNRGDKGRGGPWNASSTPGFMGNGQPVIGGTVSAVSGNTITVNTSSNVTYTVDASSAKIIKGATTSAITSVAVGDNVFIQGPVNGTTVSATTVIDGRAGAGFKGPPGNPPAMKRGVLSSIGNFFKRIFGF
jgi:hypothetical protein